MAVARRCRCRHHWCYLGIHGQVIAQGPFINLSQSRKEGSQAVVMTPSSPLSLLLPSMS
jgi:hypothetical protein